MGKSQVANQNEICRNFSLLSNLNNIPIPVIMNLSIFNVLLNQLYNHFIELITVLSLDSSETATEWLQNFDHTLGSETTILKWYSCHKKWKAMNPAETRIHL